MSTNHTKQELKRKSKNELIRMILDGSNNTALAGVEVQLGPGENVVHFSHDQWEAVLSIVHSEKEAMLDHLDETVVPAQRLVNSLLVTIRTVHMIAAFATSRNPTNTLEMLNGLAGKLSHDLTELLIILDRHGIVSDDKVTIYSDLVKVTIEGIRRALNEHDLTLLLKLAAGVDEQSHQFVTYIQQLPSMGRQTGRTAPHVDLAIQLTEKYKASNPLDWQKIAVGVQKELLHMYHSGELTGDLEPLIKYIVDDDGNPQPWQILRDYLKSSWKNRKK